MKSKVIDDITFWGEYTPSDGPDPANFVIMEAYFENVDITELLVLWDKMDHYESEIIARL